MKIVGREKGSSNDIGIRMIQQTRELWTKNLKITAARSAAMQSNFLDLFFEQNKSRSNLLAYNDLR